MNSAARPFAFPPHHISTYMTEVLHWLPVTSSILYKKLLFILKTQQM